MNSPVTPLRAHLPSDVAIDPWSVSEISVVMVVYRTGPALRESLARVLADPAAQDFVIVDNGSTPEEAAWLDQAAQHSHVTLIRGQGNVGFARGANMGARAAHGRVVTFLNPDAFIQEGCLNALAAGVVSRPQPCLVGARVLNPDGTEQRGARRGEVTPVTTLISLLRLSNRFAFLRRFEIHHESDPAPCGRLEVPTVSGASFAMLRGAFLDMGGFDEGFFLHVEDVDLCWRVRRNGGVVLFDPSATVIHLGSTSRVNPVKVEFWKGVGLVRYFRKRADNPLRALLANMLAPAIIAASLFRAVFLLKRRSRD